MPFLTHLKGDRSFSTTQWGGSRLKKSKIFGAFWWRKDYFDGGRTTLMREGLLWCGKDYFDEGRTTLMREGLLWWWKDYIDEGRTNLMREGLLWWGKDSFDEGRTTLMREWLLLLGEVCCDEEECVDDEYDAGDDAEGAEGEARVPVEGGLKPRQQCAS